MNANASNQSGRFNTNYKIKRVVWIRAAGHCELCGRDLTKDLRTGSNKEMGEVAHILPASPNGPRAPSNYDQLTAIQNTNDPRNLMLLCLSCHGDIDCDEDGYPTADLTELHQSFIKHIQEAAKEPTTGKAIPIIILSQHFKTLNSIQKSDFLRAMSAEGLRAITDPIEVVFQEPFSMGRDLHYWESVMRKLRHDLENALKTERSAFGDVPVLAVAGCADIPALIFAGRSIGDRCKRYVFSSNRTAGLRWPDQQATPPEFQFNTVRQGDDEHAIVLSLSAVIPLADVIDACPTATIHEFTVAQPAYDIVKNRRVIHAFRDELQKHLSKIESLSPSPIKIFAAIPAAFAFEFGALMTTQHQHPYMVFDRGVDKRFIPTIEIR